MTVSEFLRDRNVKIVARYKQLRADKISAGNAKLILSKEFAGLSIFTIEQVIYNKEYSNSPHKDNQ